MFAGDDPPRDVERIAADAPRQHDGAERPDEARERPQHPVLEEQHLGDGPGGGAERLEDGGLVDPLELGHRHGADQNQHAAEQHQPPDDGDGDRDLGHHVANGLQNFVKVDHRHVGKALREIVLKAGARGRIVGPLERRHEGLRRLIEHARPEYEHEAAVARVAPLHVPDARHRRVHDAAQDVEVHRVADVDEAALVDALFDRHLRGRRRPVPELPGRHVLVRFQVIAVRDGELARQASAVATDVFSRRRFGIAAVHGHDTRPQHGNEGRRARAVRRVLEKRAHGIRLIALNIEQEHVGVLADPNREFVEQARLQRSDADDEERAEADREQDDPRLVARTRQMQDAVAQRKRACTRERRDDVDEQPPGQLEHERERGEADADDHADAQRAGLPHGDADQRERHAHQRRHPRPVADARRRLIAQQERRLDEPHLQQRHDREQQRHERADHDALHRGADAHHIVGVGQNRRGRRRPRQRERNRADRRAGDRDAEQAAGEAERHHLQQVHGDDLAAARAEALEHGNAANLLLDEHAHDARHGDAAEDDDDQADEAQVVLGAVEVAPDLVVARLVRAHVQVLLLISEVPPDPAGQRIHAIVGHPHEDAPPGPTAKTEQLGRRDVVVVDQDARAKAEAADVAARFARDHAVDPERGLPDDDRIAEADAERRQQLRTHERAVMLKQRVRIGRIAGELDVAVKRKALLDRLELDHPRHRFRRIRRPDHRRRLERLGVLGAGVGQTTIDRLTDGWRPVLRGRDEQVGRDERLGFPAEHVAHALNDRPQRHDRGNADGDAHEEEQQPVPRRSRLARGHPEHEGHGAAPAPSTTRPSRSTSRRSASAASSASCVTRTTVVPRVR